MKIDLRALLAGEIRALPIDFQLTLPDELSVSVPHLWGVRFPQAMHVQGSVVNTAGYIRLQLSLWVPYIAPCARCLRDIDGTFHLELEKTAAPTKVLDGINEDKLDEYVEIRDGFLDIDELLLELLEMEFPSRLLCAEDCRGLCQQCGQDLNEGSCDCKEAPDPRLAPLQKILDELKQANPDSENKI
ncbi:MAG: DUF177 domain-containing protein [Eubacteriales bacterium]